MNNLQKKKLHFKVGFVYYYFIKISRKREYSISFFIRNIFFDIQTKKKKRNQINKD